MWFQKHLNGLLRWAIFCMIITGAFALIGTLEAQTSPAITWSRNHEPVVFLGDSTPSLIGEQIMEIYAYKFSGGLWEQIPFQVDEVDDLGDYAVEDDVLDANDELVFMAKDLGDLAGPTDWIQNGEARNSIRHQLTITNPLNTAEVGYAYLYLSGTLTPTYPDYVTWDAISETIGAESYVLGLNSADFFGLDSLELNNSGNDILDRSKIRVNATCSGFPMEINEVSIINLMDMSLTPEIDGPVRAGGGNPGTNLWAYSSFFEIQTLFDFDNIDVPICILGFSINWLRFSFDLLDPAISGMSPATYYNNNSGGGFDVDGFNDAVPVSPVNTWNQVSGADGSVVQVIDVSISGGTIENYYKDDLTIDGGDTGDQQSFADAGIRINNPSGTASLRFLEFILDPDQPKVGATYKDFFDNPLEMSVQVQSFQEQSFQSVYLPIVLR